MAAHENQINTSDNDMNILKSCDSMQLSSTVRVTFIQQIPILTLLNGHNIYIL